MADDPKKISAMIEVREIDGKTTRVIVCSECREVAAEFAEDTQIGILLVEASLERHVMFRHSNHAFETYNRARNKMEPGIVLREKRIH
jgi:hypothetical protein